MIFKLVVFLYALRVFIMTLSKFSVYLVINHVMVNVLVELIKTVRDVKMDIILIYRIIYRLV